MKCFCWWYWMSFLSSKQQMTLGFDILCDFLGWKPSAFLKKKIFAHSSRVHHDLQCLLLPSTLTTDTRVWDRTSTALQITVDRGREIEKKKSVNKPQNSSKIVIVLWSIHRVDKKQKNHWHVYIHFCNDCTFTYVLRNVNRICIFMWNIIKPLQFLCEMWLLAFFCEHEAVFRIFGDAWKG